MLKFCLLNEMCQYVTDALFDTTTCIWLVSFVIIFFQFIFCIKSLFYISFQFYFLNFKKNRMFLFAFLLYPSLDMFLMRYKEYYTNLVLSHVQRTSVTVFSRLRTDLNRNVYICIYVI